MLTAITLFMHALQHKNGMNTAGGILGCSMEAMAES